MIVRHFLKLCVSALCLATCAAFTFAQDKPSVEKQSVRKPRILLQQRNDKQRINKALIEDVLDKQDQKKDADSSETKGVAKKSKGKSDKDSKKTDDKKVKELKAKVEKLIRQLDADEKAERDAAEKQLVKLGPKILPFLTSAGGEAGQRISRVRNELERQAVAENTKPTKVTIQGEMSVAEIFKSIEKQTGNKFANTQQFDKKIKLDLKDVDFWKATDEILDKSDLTVSSLFVGNAGALSLAERNGMGKRSGKAAYSGIFRMEATRIFASRNLRSSGQDSCRVAIEVGWEPRLRPISISLPIDKLKAVDDKGNELSVNYAGRAISANVQSEIPVVEINVPFQLPKRGANKLASVKGTLDVVVPGRMEEFEFKGLTKPRRQNVKKAGVTVTCEGFKKNLDLYGVRVRVRFDNSNNAMESYQDWIYSNEARLIDDKDNSVDNIGLKMFMRSENEVGFEYLFDLTKKPEVYRLKYRSPTGIVSQPIKFELKNIDLP